MLDRFRTAERWTRSFAAAVTAVAALVLAANAGPAKAAHPDAGPDTWSDSQRPATAPVDPVRTTAR
ncbi:hypothetical protein [Streptomyces sp. NPDC052012]|uniref:hypothetical protein n=1 Tax=Streptomyces sp. NPDC052012 TaxID=3155051 RepID=UPI00344FE08B